MKRWTNLALFVLLGLAFVTGWVAFFYATAPSRASLIVHAVSGYAIVALTPWKSVIASHGIRRRRSGWWASVVLTALVLVSVVAGILHSTGLLAAGPAGGELRSPVDLRRAAGVRRSGEGDARLHRRVLLDPGLVRSLAEPVACVFPNRWRTSPSPLWGGPGRGSGRGRGCRQRSCPVAHRVRPAILDRVGRPAP